MKILYGIQGTGNGHITRARALAQYFEEFSINADYLFSGRPQSQYFDMDVFGDQWCAKTGLTFCHKAGKLSVLNTLKNAEIRQFIHDVKNLDLSAYDAVITDFEPITAWAAKQQNKMCIGIGHQYAFEHDVPKAGNNIFTDAIMARFAPCKLSLGLHWNHFDSPILPPIAQTHSVDEALVDPDKILVYFGFEAPDEVINLLEKFPEKTFLYYGPFAHYENIGNIQFKPFSREGFKHDLAICGGVISNAGFELASEAIQLGKKILVKPLHGQMEQLSNALALERLKLGKAMESLDPSAVHHWLNHFEAKRIHYPNVAHAIVAWIREQKWDNKNHLIRSMWDQTEYTVAKSENKEDVRANDNKVAA